MDKIKIIIICMVLIILLICALIYKKQDVKSKSKFIKGVIAENEPEYIIGMRVTDVYLLDIYEPQATYDREDREWEASNPKHRKVVWEWFARSRDNGKQMKIPTNAQWVYIGYGWSYGGGDWYRDGWPTFSRQLQFLVCPKPPNDMLVVSGWLNVPLMRPNNGIAWGGARYAGDTIPSVTLTAYPTLEQSVWPVSMRWYVMAPNRSGYYDTFQQYYNSQTLLGSYWYSAWDGDEHEQCFIESQITDIYVIPFGEIYNKNLFRFLLPTAVVYTSRKSTDELASRPE